MNKQPNVNKVQTMSSKYIKAKRYNRSLNYLALLPLLLFSVTANAITFTKVGLETASHSGTGLGTGGTYTGIVQKNSSKVVQLSVSDTSSGACAVSVEVESGPCTLVGSAVSNQTCANGGSLQVAPNVKVQGVGECRIKYNASGVSGPLIGIKSSYAWTEIWQIQKEQPTIIWQFVPSQQEALTTITISAEVKVGATTTNQTVTYESMTASVCSVSGSGANVNVTANKAGSCQVKVVANENSGYLGTAAVRSWQIIKKPSAITVNSAIPASMFIHETWPVAAIADSGVAVDIMASGSCILSGNAITAISEGNCTVTYQEDMGNEIYSPAASVTNFATVSKRTQAIMPSSLPGTVFVNDTFEVSATSDAGLDVAITANGSCTLAGTTVTATAQGSCTVSFSQAGNAEYFAAPSITETVAIEKRAQTLTPSLLPSAVFVNDTFEVSATTNAGLDVAIVATGNCTLAGTTVTATAQGSCTVTFNQAGNAEYFAATSITETITIEKRAQTITPSLLPSSAFVTDTFSVSATSDASLDVDITVAGSCTLAVPTVTADAEGSCTVTYNQPGNAEFLAAPTLTKTVNIEKKSQTLDIVAPTASIFDELFDVSATASSGLTPVSIAPSGGCGFDDGSSTENSAQLVSTAAGSCTVTFTQAGNNEFAEVVGTRTVTIAKADQAITIIEGIPGYGTINVDYPVSAEADSGLPVAITVSGDCIKVGNYVRPKTPAAGSGTCTVSYKQAGNSNYNPADVLTEEMTVQVGQTINITQALPISGKFDDKVQTAATTTSGLPVHISVSGGCELDPAPAGTDSHVLSTAGVHLTAIGVCTVTYSQPGGEIGGVWYDEAPSLSRSVTVDKWTQNIVITRQPPAAEQAGLAVVVEAIAEPTDAVNPRGVTISVAAGSSCTVLSSEDNIATIKLNTTGSSCTLYFNQAGNQLYKPAPQLSRTITISQVTDGNNIGNFWPSNKLFTTGASAGTIQPIMAPPMVARNGDVKAAKPNLMVIFGTGKYHENRDLSDKSLNTIYGVHDRGEYDITRYGKKTGSVKNKLAKRVFTEKAFTVGLKTQNNRKVSGDAVDWVDQYGWYVDLASDTNKNGVIDAGEMLGERSVFRPFIANKLYVFNTVLPTVGTCSGATQGWTMLIDWASGLAPNFATYDANMDGGFDSDDKGFVGYYNETAGSELGRGGDSIYDTSGEEARRRSVTFGTADSGVRLGWEEKTPYGVLKRDAN